MRLFSSDERSPGATVISPRMAEAKKYNGANVSEPSGVSWADCSRLRSESRQVRLTASGALT